MIGADLELMRAWLAARSLARGLPMPVADSGGWRVDSGLPEEARRYLFVAPVDGIATLGAAIDEPFVALKLCGSTDDLLALLPPRWVISSESWVMVRDAMPGDAPTLPEGYCLTMETRGPAGQVTIVDAAGALAASGYCVEADGVFIYDRIRTQADHQRRGLGRAMLAALGRQRRSPASREILTATAEGRALYLTLGWRDYAPYSTAMIPA